MKTRILSAQEKAKQFFSDFDTLVYAVKLGKDTVVGVSKFDYNEKCYIYLPLPDGKYPPGTDITVSFLYAQAGYCSEKMMVEGKIVGILKNNALTTVSRRTRAGEYLVIKPVHGNMRVVFSLPRQVPIMDENLRRTNPAEYLFAQLEAMQNDSPDCTRFTSDKLFQYKINFTVMR